MQKLVLVGRPNVGKSSLYNALLHSRSAIVAPHSGLTRDRQYGVARLDGRACMLIDTGGLATETDMDRIVAVQTHHAIEEADTIALVVDASEGLTPTDQILATEMRKLSKELWLIVNKIDQQNEQYYQSEFTPLAVSPCFYTAAASRRGTKQLLSAIVEQIGEPLPFEDSDTVRLAVIGRPNVGKSTLINNLIKKERLLTSDTPGTTRSAISVDFTFNNHIFALVDTAGIRRRSKVHDHVEKLSVLQALEHIVLSHVVVLVCDASQGVTEQDARLAARAVEQGCALVIALNKYDLVDGERQLQLQRTLDLGLGFLDYAEQYRISALKKSGLSKLMHAVIRAYESARVTVTTADCNRILQSAIERHSPPLVRNRRIKPRYICQVGKLPPRFIISGNQVDCLPDAYKRYLMSYIRQRLNLKGTPIVLEFSRTPNPFVPNNNN